MNTVGCISKSLPKNTMLILLASVIFLTAMSGSVLAKAANSEKQKVISGVAQNYIKAGVRQYERGYYAAAEQSFLRALDYQEYLADREKLNSLLAKAHAAVVERKRILDNIRSASQAIQQNELRKAKGHLQAIEGSGLLTEQEKSKVALGLAKINEQIKLLPPVSLEPEEVSAAISLEEELLGLIVEKAQAVPRQTVHVSNKPVAIAPQPVTEEPGYLREVNRRRSILQSHTRAIVVDATNKAQQYLSQDKFSEAKKAVETAEETVNKNRTDLGEELYKQYTSQLAQLTDTIVQKQNSRTQQLQKQKRTEAIETQHRYREQMEADRGKRMAELMQNAIAFQKKQRYENALGQLESLLAIDAQSRDALELREDALILKQTLEDTINFRRQLEVQRESDRERVEILIRTDETGIPYADELKYAKNWREIIASPFRKPEGAIGQDAASLAAYKQMDEIVDLAELTPEMPLSEAIDVMKNSVDPSLKVFVNWRDLYDNADIDQTTPINMDEISSIPLRAALKLLLEAVSGGFAELGYIIEDGVITIATVDSLPSEMQTLVYDVTDLIGKPADFFEQSPTGGGGGQSGGSVRGGFQSDGGSRQRTPEQLLAEALIRAENLLLLIQETINPDSWYEAGGDGSITIYENKKLVVRQSREVHAKIDELFNEMRKSLGHQVSIEARFLLVGENFLEDIGLDIDIRYNVGGKFGVIGIEQGSAETTLMRQTSIPGSLGATPGALANEVLSAMNMSGTYGNMLLNDLQVDFLLRATEAHSDSTAVTAPKVSVLSGESAALRVQKIFGYPSDIQINTREIGGTDNTNTFFTINYQENWVTTGSILNITPTIMPDKKHVLLSVVAELQDFLGFRSQTINLGLFGGSVPGAGASFNVDFPETEVSRVQTRVCVPDGGTLLLGGQKMTIEVEKESGVPVLSKLPIIGRLFSNRGRIRDHRVLLILVKPTIILQAEAEAKAIASVENDF